MFHCPFCKTSAHARTSRYLSENVKQRYHQRERRVLGDLPYA